MRREGKLGLARTLKGCCAGRGHLNPYAGTQHLDHIRSLFTAWRQEAGVSPKRQPWVVKEAPNCCSSSKGKGPRICFGHNYSHIANCHMCREGNPSKSMKKNRGTQQRRRHLELMNDARCVTLEDVDCPKSTRFVGARWQQANSAVRRSVARLPQSATCDVDSREASEAARPSMSAQNSNLEIDLALIKIVPRRAKGGRLCKAFMKCCPECQPRASSSLSQANATHCPTADVGSRTLEQDWLLV